MNQQKKAQQFAKLHIKGNPLILYNAWDAGSAKTIVNAGAQAIATSSWAVAEAQGYQDGEDLPKGVAEQVIERIVAIVDVPVSLDFEGGYSEDESALAENISRILDLGVVGINFEDRVVKGSSLYSIDKQAKRIAAIRKAADKKGVTLFINARTDIFLGHTKNPPKSIGEALERAKAYADAGASGYFVPGLVDDALIGQVCEGTSLPVNVMVMEGVSPAKQLAKIGASRISYGPIPYIHAMESLGKQAQKVLA
jgi:2-methylisocitrate lyase-like PEP mutase family enzyme